MQAHALVGHNLVVEAVGPPVLCEEDDGHRLDTPGGSQPRAATGWGLQAAMLKIKCQTGLAHLAIAVQLQPTGSDCIQDGGIVCDLHWHA